MKKDKYLGNDYFQLTGKHLMGHNFKWECDKETLKKIQEKAEKDQLQYVANLMSKDKDCKPYEDKVLVPPTNRIIVLPYNKNPYRVPIHQQASGLIIGDFELNATHKSWETGEEEESQRGIWCCKVIAVGDECKSVIEGEDVYINFTMAAPVPFGGKGYYTITENNVICSVRYKQINKNE